jgi:hypothetical protein
VKGELTYKKKFRFLLIAVALMIIICYRFSIRETINQYGRYEDYLKNVELNGIRVKTDKGVIGETIHSMLNRYLLDTLNPDKNLIYRIGEFCLDSNLTITEYKPIGSTDTKMKLFTRQVIVQGSFNHCLDLIYYLERDSQLGRVQAARFWSYTDVKDKTVRLNCSIYIQNLTSLP